MDRGAPLSMYLASGKKKHDRTFWVQRRGGPLGTSHMSTRATWVSIGTNGDMAGFTFRLLAAGCLCVRVCRLGAARCNADVGQEEE